MKPWGKVRVGENLVNRARNIFEEPLLVHLVKHGLLQNAWYTRRKRDAHSGKVRFRTSNGWRTAQQKTSANKGDKTAVTTVKETINLGFVSQDMELNRAKTNPKCSIHWRRSARCRSSRPKSIAQQHLPWRMSSAKPEWSKIWEMVSSGDRMARALGSRSSAEVGKENPQIGRE